MNKIETVHDQEYLCTRCGRVDVYHFGAEPTHCGIVMAPNRSRIRGGDPEAITLSLVDYVRGKWTRDTAVHDTSLIGKNLDDLQADYFEPPETWRPCFEVWKLSPGRINGERIGWLGLEHAAGGLIQLWQYKMVRGVSSFVSEGSQPTKEEALYQMWLAING